MSIHKIHRHFQHIDPIIYKVMETMTLNVLQPNKNDDGYFSVLCREIIGQQLSTKVANVIAGRFYALFVEKEVAPQSVLDISDQKLRDIGMSWAKIKYVKDLATKVLNGEVRLDNLSALSNEEVITELTKVKGIGQWTAEMFLMFTLGREDVFSFGDLGLKRALQKLYGLDEKMKADEVNAIVEVWSPYRTYGCLALWSSLDNKK